MNKPHKHAEIIKAWADGADIEYYSAELGCWQDVVCNSPIWYNASQYRVKPIPKIEKKFIFAQHFEKNPEKIDAKIWPEGMNHIDEAIIQVTLTDGKVTAVELTR